MLKHAATLAYDGSEQAARHLPPPPRHAALITAVRRA